MSQMQYASAKAQIANEKGIANGVASLDGSGKVPSSQLPSYVDDVLEYSSQSAFPATGEIGKIYVATDTNKSYRWSGSTYVELSAYALATQAAAGLMSSTDKTKLDGIATGATANTGDVVGPSSSTDGTIPLFDGTTGKAIKAGKTITDVTSSTAIANNANIPTNRTVRNGIYNGLDKTAAGFALDARQGKAINDKIAAIGGVTNTAINKAVTAQTITQIASFSLTAGKWLINCITNLSASYDGVYNIYITPGSASSTDYRNNALGGGGASNMLMIGISTTTTIKITAYLENALTVRGTCQAIYLGESS